jgi:hypothetical protein
MMDPLAWDLTIAAWQSGLYPPRLPAARLPDPLPVEACPGCGCMPGDGLTATCDHPDGCGYSRTYHNHEED